MRTTAEQRIKAKAQLDLARNTAALLKVAESLDEPMEDAEFNFWADITMVVHVAQGTGKAPNLETLLRVAEQGMLQLAFHNHGIQPPAAFIIQAHAAGWRYLHGTFNLVSPCPGCGQSTQDGLCGKCKAIETADAHKGGE
jgi:hypothetical protein